MAGNTLFVRNLPYSTTKETLEGIFSLYGPLKNCFIVHDKNQKSRGFAYVTYALKEDAVRAKSYIKVVSNRPVQIVFANKKSEPTPAAVKEDVDKELELGKKDSCYDIGRTIVIKNIHQKTTKQQLRVRLRKLGLIETLEYPVPGKEDLTCCVCYKTRSSAQHAVKTLNHKSLNGQLLEVKLLSKDIKPTKKSSLKKSRVIVRNISFKCTEEELTELFTSHGGTVISVDIPKNSNNKPLGYGFVQLSSYLEAQEAIKKVNGTTFKGRPIAVDWVISRDNYKRYMEALNEEENDEEREKESDDQEVNDDEEREKESGDQEMNDDEERGEMEGEESDEEGLFDKKEEGESDDDEDDDDEDDDDDDDGGQIESDISNEQERFDNGSDDEDNSKASIRTEPTKVKDKPSDVHEGKTLFVRNIPFDADEEELSDVFRHYGSIKYCKLVIDQETKLCKGTGFVQYKEIGSVNKCIESASSDEGIMYRQDRLNVVVALSKEELSRKKKIEEEERSSQKDKRNLYLLDEGYIDPSSETAQELSKNDMNKRERSYAERKRKLRNPYYYVSQTRLSVRNIPATVDEKSLKDLVMGSCDLKPFDIKQIKLIRTKADGIGRSLGYGFIELKSHQSALVALRALNNNPNICGTTKRPIVEFAIEDSRAIKLMKQRRERRAESQTIHTNKKVSWQLKWKAKRLKRKSETATTGKKIERKKVHDSKRKMTVNKVKTTKPMKDYKDLNSKILNYKKKLLKY